MSQCACRGTLEGENVVHTPACCVQQEPAPIPGYMLPLPTFDEWYDEHRKLVQAYAHALEDHLEIGDEKTMRAVDASLNWLLEHSRKRIRYAG